MHPPFGPHNGVGACWLAHTLDEPGVSHALQICWGPQRARRRDNRRRSRRAARRPCRSRGSRGRARAPFDSNGCRRRTRSRRDTDARRRRRTGGRHRPGDWRSSRRKARSQAVVASPVSPSMSTPEPSAGTDDDCGAADDEAGDVGGAKASLPFVGCVVVDAARRVIGLVTRALRQHGERNPGADDPDPDRGDGHTGATRRPPVISCRRRRGSSGWRRRRRRMRRLDVRSRSLASTRACSSVRWASTSGRLGASGTLRR